ncbi:MAG: Imidazoleglycerol-phosphate dehydratase HisB [Candidatus Methanohalarchaeum thermophilum]|uniref:Imidazoleglycerol-phosphate dehydratase n=1 Tax=Methanohalarchaeum thermophilum TaxID=1903181 RepID=A0A1Q6DXU0_METT1|nr:MAG: Imidazoleglycerol-phosphate dehydratase HisB [Candidatus Methanohalarchaeum thermophilum]
MRKSSKKRVTDETDIKVKLNLDKKDDLNISSGIPFFDHMLEAFCKHGEISLTLEAEGDTEVGYHHTIEDIGIVLGKTLSEIIDYEKINRFGSASIPMDDAITETSLDLCGRSYLVSEIPTGSVSGVKTEDLDHFFRSFVNHCGMTLHIYSKGENQHHVFESVFKSFAHSFKEAVERKEDYLRSTKGKLGDY